MFYFPLPVVIVGPISAAQPKAHGIACDIRSNRNFQPDVSHVGRLTGADFNRVVQRTIELNAAFQTRAQRAGPACDFPRGNALRLFREAQRLQGPLQDFMPRIFNQHLYRPRQHRALLLAALPVHGETAAYQTRKPARRKQYIPAQHSDSLSNHLNRRIRRHNTIVLSQGGIQPAQPRQVLRIVIAGVSNQLRRNMQAHRDGRLRLPIGRDCDGRGILSGSGVCWNLHAAPDRLNFPPINVQNMAEWVALPIGST